MWTAVLIGLLTGAFGMALSMRWVERAPMLRAQAGGAVAAFGGRMVVAGGTHWDAGIKHYLREVQIFDAAANHWMNGPELPAKIAYGAFVSGPDGLEILGGINESGVTRRIFTWKPPQPQWSESGEAPADTVFGRAARIGARTILLGGCSDQADLTRCTSAVWMRDRGRWTAVSKMPAGKVSLGAHAAIGNKIYLFGGCVMPAPGELRNLATAYTFDAATFEWKRLRDLPATVRGPSAFALDEHTVLIFGGYGEAGFQADVWAYDIRADSYRNLGAMPFGGVGIEFVRIGDHLIGAGGEDKMRSRSARTIAMVLKEIR